MMMNHQTKLCCKSISSSEEMVETHLLLKYAFIVTSTLKTANQSFCVTLLLMMLPHHIKFGSKRF